MKKILTTITTLLFLGVSTLLSSCGSQPSITGHYVEDFYCRTNMDAINQYQYATVAQIKTVMPYLKDETGSLTSENLEPVYPFDTNAIYIRYASQYLSSYKEVMQIESLVGKYTAECHQLFDRHYYYLDENNNIINNIKVINDSYGSGDWISVDSRLIEVLKISKEITKISKGKFNIFIGELSSFWEYYLSINSIIDPADKTIDPAHTQEGKNQISELVKNTPKWDELDEVLEIDEINKKVRFNKYYPDGSSNYAPKVSITLGGIGKGYLSENLYQRLKANNLTYGLVYAGASSLVFMGPRVTNDTWNVRLTNPYYQLENPVGYLDINEKMIFSTSGSQVNRYITIVDDEIVLRQHIIDPTTGYPAKFYPQVTLLSRTISSTVMDALSTVFINCSYEEIAPTIATFEDKYGDLEYIFYNCDLSLSGAARSVKLSVSKKLKDDHLFTEYNASESENYIPVTYEYLEY